MHQEAHNLSFDNLNEESFDLPTTVNADLYSVLMVSHDATQEEIQNSYRRLSRIYHPDKHSRDSENYESSQLHFTKIKEAYDILNDPKIRKMYDMYGMKGVDLKDLEIVPRTKDPNEMQMIFETHQLLKEEQTKSKLTRSQMESSVGIDMTDIFDRYLKEDPSERYLYPKISIYKANLVHAVCLGSTGSDTVNLTTSCSLKNGIGAGQLTASWRKFLYPRFQDTWIDFETSVNTDSELETAISVSRRFWEKFTLKFGGGFLMPRFGVFAPGLSMAFLWNISDNLYGEIQYKWNLNSQLSSRLIWVSPNRNHDIRLGGNISDHDMYMSLYYYYLWQQQKSDEQKLHDPEDWTIDERSEPFKLKIGGVYGFRSAYAELGISRRITKFTTFGISLSVGIPIGVLARFKIIRGDQTYTIPVIMSEEIDPAATFYASVVPVAIFAAAKRLLYDPWKQDEVQRQIKIKRELFQNELQKSRQEAYSAQNLMSETAKRSYEREIECNGLIVEYAVYGRLTKISVSQSQSKNNDHHDDPISQEIVDITIPLQVMVENSKLRLPACRPGFTRGQLQGFYDPCLGLFSTMSSVSTSAGDSANGIDIHQRYRQLYVRYKFRNKLHETVKADNEELALPLECHQIK